MANLSKIRGKLAAQELQGLEWIQLKLRRTPNTVATDQSFPNRTSERIAHDSSG
ncbi:hypothetical protein [Scytonema hofmannii]|uniref:hypothetical protein n=1 Tax=Scytonema hofmannii TaxID=34078 RepID=UPI001314D3D2|nr:hypothetical protein [Scytonema hofmannii]